METAVIEIVSDDETEVPFAAAKPPADALGWASSLLLDDDDDLTGFGEGLDDSAVIQDFLTTLEGEKKSAAEDDDDCVILDGDPDKGIVVLPKEEKKPGEKDGPEEELQVLGEKGQVACRDFPHPRHLCAKLPFRTGSHANHCTMCHCYVCDSPAPCPSWGKGTLPTDHCHATDKDAKWSKQRQSLKRKILPPSKHGSTKKILLSSTTPPSSQQYAGQQVSVPQPFTTLGITVNQAAAGRLPVASNLIQNQILHPSVRSAQNMFRSVHPPKASAPAPKPSDQRSKRPAAAPTVYTAPNGYSVKRAIPNDVPWRSTASGVLQTGQGAPGSHGLPVSNGLPGMNGAPGNNGLPGMNGAPGRNGQPGKNGAPGRNGLHGRYGAQGSDGAPGRPGKPGGTVTVIHGYPTQRSLAAPVQVRPRAHLQAAQNMVLQVAKKRGAAAGRQAIQNAVRSAQGTQRTQDPSGIQKTWQAVLASLASDLGVSDYNINPPQVQQPVRTQSLQHSQLLSQAKVSQEGEMHRGNTPATAQMRPSNGLRPPNPKYEDGVAAMPKTQATQALCVLNSDSSLAPSETYLNSLVAKPAAKQ